MQVGQLNSVNYGQFVRFGAINKKDTNISANASVNSYSTQAVQMPSFGALKPLTENQKCRKMLLDAETKNGKMRFVTTDEINLMMQSIKKFKTALPKTRLLKLLLTYKEGRVKDSPKIPSDLSAKNIADYFKYMSGMPKDMQKYLAKDLGESIDSHAEKRLSLVSSGNVTAKDFEYFDKHMEGDDKTREIKFAFLFDFLEECPGLIEYRKILVDKIDQGPEVWENINTLLNHYRPRNKDVKPIANLLSLMNEDNTKKMEYFVSRICGERSMYSTALLSLLNKDNFDYAYEALGNANIKDVVEDLSIIKKNKIALPTREGFADGDLYYNTISEMLHPTEEVKEDDDIFN